MSNWLPPDSQEIFTKTSGSPIEFHMPICPEKEEYCRKIKEHGGTLKSITGGQHVIHLLPPSLKDRSSAFDVFSTRYIDECIKAGKLLRLESYRIGLSRYKTDIKVNAIMLGERSWEDCSLATEKNSIEQEKLFDDDDDIVAAPSKIVWRGRKEYDHRERRSILNYILDNREYHRVKGKALWIEMEKANVCRGRTWESMKEHYRKYIINNLFLFRIDEKTQRKLTAPFAKGMQPSKMLPSDDSDEDMSISSDREENKKRNEKDIKRREELVVETRSKEEENSCIKDKPNISTAHLKDVHSVEENEEQHRSSLNNNEELVPTEASCGKGGDEVYYYSSDSTVISETEEENIAIKQDKGVINNDNDVNGAKISDREKSLEYNQVNISPSKKPAPSFGESNEVHGSDATVSSNCTQAFDILYTNEELSKKTSDLHVPKDGIVENHHLSVLDTEVSSSHHEICSDVQENACVSNARVSQLHVTGGEDLLDSNNLDSRIKNISALITKDNHEKSSGSSVTRASEDNKQVAGNPKSKKNNFINHLPREMDKETEIEGNSSDVYASPISGTQSEIYVSCAGNITQGEQHDKEITARENPCLKSKDDHLNHSSRNSHSLSSGSSTVLYPMSPSKKRKVSKDHSSQDINKSRNNDETDSEQRKDMVNDSDSDSHVEDEESSTECEIVLRRDTRVQISRVAQKNQKEKYQEDCMGTVNLPLIEAESDEENFFYSASDRNSLNGRYDRTYRPKSGMKEGDKGQGKRSLSSMSSGGWYTREEDVKILKYIMDRRRYNEVRGVSLWQDMEKSKIIPGRTWQGLKERYRKRIEPRLPSYARDGISKSHLKRLSVNGDGQENRPKEIFEGHRKQWYTIREDELILNFICSTKRHAQVGGKMMWELMAESVEELNGRTWLSLKERYRKVILRNLSSYKLSDEDVRKLKKGKKRRAIGTRVYFKEEKTTDEDESSETDGSSNLSDSPSKNSASGKRKSNREYQVKLNRREDSKRALRRKQVIDKHLDFEPTPGTSNDCQEKSTKKSRTFVDKSTASSSDSCQEVTVANKSKKKLYSSPTNLLLDQCAKKTRTLSMSPTLNHRPKEECAQESAIVYKNSNDNEGENCSESKNTEESAAESEEIPLLSGIKSSNQKLSNSRDVVDTAIMDESKITSSLCDTKKGEEPETSTMTRQCTTFDMEFVDPVLQRSLSDTVKEKEPEISGTTRLSSTFDMESVDPIMQSSSDDEMSSSGKLESKHVIEQMPEIPRHENSENSEELSPHRNSSLVECNANSSSSSSPHRKKVKSLQSLPFDLRSSVRQKLRTRRVRRNQK